MNQLIQTSLYNISVGEVVQKLSDPTQRPSAASIYDLYMTESTLIVPRWNEKSVLFYELK